MKKWMSLSLLLSVVASHAFAAEETTNFKLDDSHAAIVFKVSHLGFSNVLGTFGASEGKIMWNEAKPDKSSFEVTTKVDSITTQNKKRDEHLASPDFFNSKQFPTISLKSKSIKSLGGNKFDVLADLTMHGVTKPVKFVFNHMKTGMDPWGKMRTGGETSFKVKRSDFNMTYMNKPGEIGDDVELMVNLEAVKE